MSLPAGSAFKGHMLPKVGDSLLMRLFVTTPDIEHQTNVGNLCMRNLLMGNANAVGQGMQAIVFQKVIQRK
jgi:hypothetical protein